MDPLEGLRTRSHPLAPFALTVDAGRLPNCHLELRQYCTAESYCSAAVISYVYRL